MVMDVDEVFEDLLRMVRGIGGVAECSTEGVLKYTWD